MQTQPTQQEDFRKPWTAEQRAKRLADAVRLAEHGPEPQGPVTGASAAVAAPAGAPITTSDLLALEYHAEPYTLHNGKTVWVHPVSIDEAAWLNCQAWKEVAALGPMDEKATAIQFQLRAQVWQCVACLRTGPEPDASKAMQAEHAEILRRNAGWLPDVQQITTISDRLTGGSTETERLKAALRAFFVGATSCCETLLSQADTATVGDLRELLQGFAGSVSLARSLLSPATE